VAVRLLPQERDILAKTARSRGITLSEFIRASAMESASAPAAEVEAWLSLGTLKAMPWVAHDIKTSTARS
jgi:hypothetical protein